MKKLMYTCIHTVMGRYASKMEKIFKKNKLSYNVDSIYDDLAGLKNNYKLKGTKSNLFKFLKGSGMSRKQALEEMIMEDKRICPKCGGKKVSRKFDSITDYEIDENGESIGKGTSNELDNTWLECPNCMWMSEE